VTTATTSPATTETTETTEDGSGTSGSTDTDDPTTTAGSESETNTTAPGTTSDTDSETTSDSDGTQTSDSETETSGETESDTDTDTDTEGDQSIPVHEIPGLESITFYERTGGSEPTAYTFTVLGPELTTELADPLGNANRDIEGTSVEFYDVHYSDIDGNFDIDGSYLTIAGSFGAALPSGGGLNLAEISLNYADDSVEFGSFLASFVALGDKLPPTRPPCRSMVTCKPTPPWATIP